MNLLLDDLCNRLTKNRSFFCTPKGPQGQKKATKINDISNRDCVDTSFYLESAKISIALVFEADFSLYKFI